MPKDTTAIETTNANKIFDIPVTLEPGQVNTMSFPQDSISTMRLLPGDQLEVSFRDGSKVQVENFGELVNSAQSCGRDTIIQLSDNTIIYPEVLNEQLAKGAVAFGDKNTGESTIALDAPKAGQTVEKSIEPGHEYKLGFDTDATSSAAQAGNNLIITFKDGGIMVLKNYFTSMNSDLPPAMTLADGSVVDSTALLTSCKIVETPSYASTVGDEQIATAKVAEIEPAAGEEKAAKVAQVEPAAGEDVAAIEPAAGSAGGISGGRGGYGFSSEPGQIALGGINPLGVIGVTSLAYQAPNFRNGPTGANPPGTTAIPVTPGLFIAAAQSLIDESGVHTVGGQVNFDFGNDGPSTTVPPIQPTGTFAVGGSVANGVLTSNGVIVSVIQVGNTYTGSANGQTVFTFVMNTDGSYVFTQSRPLDHADPADANDRMTLNFGIVATDRDGDTATTSVNIFVLDDAPTAFDDVATVGSAPLVTTGNVLTNDLAGFDGDKTVVGVSFNGTPVTMPAAGTMTIVGNYGTLVINANGTYTYTSSKTALGTDNFLYTMRDFDGDQSSATLAVTVTDIGTVPTITNAVNTVDETNLGPITVTGAVTANYFGDGPGTVSGSNTFSSGGSKLGGNLTSNGAAVAVTFANGVYTGTANGTTIFTLTVNANGSYSFTQNGVLDHANAANPNDAITLNFGVRATDKDGDTANGTISITVLDDGPTAVADVGQVTVANPTITGNVTSNDNFGADGRPVHAVTKVVFNGTTYDLPTNGANVTITSVNGTLTINHTGQYSYTSTTTTGGRDVYSYVIQDRDGDTDTVPATSTLTITVDDVDFTPTITNAVNTVDETNLGPITVTGAVTANYFGDGPGTVSGSNTFSSGGSKLGGNLTSNGAVVAVTFANGVYTGTANGQTIFTLTVNPNGSYSFTQNGVLDHANASDPNDSISLNFGVRATDNDGDTANGTITINVLDDGPTAVADTGTVTAANPTITGNVTSNDNFGADGRPVHAVTKVVFNGTTYDLPTNGANVTITSVNGTLTINHTGQYSYTSTTTTGGRDVYSYVIQDRDGDTDTVPATSTLTITVDDIDFTPTITNDTKTVDETNMNPTTGVSGSVTANFFGDGPGTIVGGNTFSSDGSKTGGNLTSNGVAVNVTYANGVYTGTAAGVTVFTLAINNNGSYNFVLNRPLDHADRNDPNDSIGLHFGVIARDADGDVANGTININVLDDGPSIGPATSQIDESNFNTPGGRTVTGAVNVDYGSDAPGTTTSNNVFSSTGSQLNGQLSSNGVAVIVTQTATGYVGTANGQEVFSFTINNNGGYTYNQSRILDHADRNDPNDIINLHFGVRATDSDGDTANTTVTVNVLDDGPVVIAPPSALLCVNNYEDNILLPKDYGVWVSVTADSIGSGSQVMTLTMTGVPPSWIFATNFGSYNAAAQTWTYTTQPGADFNSKFYFQPPAGSTVDLTGINVTVVTTENGQSHTTSDDFNIIVAGFDGAGARMASSSHEDFGTESLHNETVSNDNLSHYSNVIETAGHSETQSAIDSFVYSTSAKNSVSTSNVSTNESSTSSVAALAPTAAEELHHAQQQVA